MLFRPTGGSGSNAFYEIKVGILLVGGALGVAGMLTERTMLVWTAIAIVAVGILLRFVQRRRDDAQKPD